MHEHIFLNIHRSPVIYFLCMWLHDEWRKGRNSQDKYLAMKSVYYSHEIAHQLRSSTQLHSLLYCWFFVCLFYFVLVVCLLGGRSVCGVYLGGIVTIYSKLAEILNILLMEIKVSAMQVNYRKYQSGIQGLIGLIIPLYFCRAALLFEFLCKY